MAIVLISTDLYENSQQQKITCSKTGKSTLRILFAPDLNQNGIIHLLKIKIAYLRSCQLNRTGRDLNPLE